MSLQLHCTKAKIFHRVNHTSEQHVSCARGVKTSVPDWVKDTLGYKMGIKDESIVDLTPPRAAVPAKEAEKRPAKADAASADEAPEPDTSADEGGEPEDAMTDAEVAAEEEAAQQPAKRAAANRTPKGIVSASTVIKK